jgi:hypothetical protein
MQRHKYNNPVHNEWHDARSDTYSADVTLATGNHLVKIEFYEAAGIAQIQVWWQGITSYPEWHGEYWANDALTGSSVLVRNDTAVDFGALAHPLPIYPSTTSPCAGHAPCPWPKAITASTWSWTTACASM